MAEHGFWQDRPVFITGATGLLGSWLTKSLLELGADVVCLVRDGVPHSEAARSGLLERVKTVHGDVRDRDLLERALSEYEISVVFHLAAQTIVGTANRNPVATFEANVGGTWNLLESCRRTPTIEAVLVASSDKAYGPQTELPYTEATPLQGRFPYDVSKSCTDLIAQSYASTYNLPVAITRCGNFFGGGDLNWNRIVPGTIRSLLRGDAPVIRSDGEFVRDYIYVEDGAAAYLLLAEKLLENPALIGKAYNFSNEVQYTVLDLVDMIRNLLGSDIKPQVLGQASNEIRYQYLSAAAAREELGWAPKYTLEEGLKKTVDWYKAFLESQPHHA
jgi:CDP-glucose 4,6-dehydratase